VKILVSENEKNRFLARYAWDEYLKMMGVVMLQVFVLPSEVQRYNAFGLVHCQIIIIKKTLSV